MKNQIFKQFVSFATGLALVFSGVIPALAGGTAVLYFGQSAVSVNTNTEFDIDIMLNTGGDATSAVDAIVLFDTTKLDYVGIDDVGSDFLPPTGALGGVIATTSKVNEGRVVISGLLANTAPVSGSALKVGTVIFKTKANLTNLPIATTLSYAFDPANPDDTTNASSNVAPIAGSGEIDLLGSTESAVVTITDVPISTPIITSINPTSGSFNTPSNVAINGTNFGLQGASGKVMLGTKNMTVTTWSDTLINAVFPAEPDLTQSSGPLQVKVIRDDGVQATKYGFTYFVGTDDPTPTPPPIVNGNMQITYIYPASGSKMAPNEVTIYGSGFGTYTESSQVYIGLEEMTNILDWNNTRIMVQVSPRPGLTNKVTLSVKVYNATDSAEYLGYTYLMTPLPGTGPEHWMWAGIVATAFTGAWIVYRKLNQPVEVVNEYSDYQF